MKFKKGTIKITTWENNAVAWHEVPAFVSGNIAYHHPLNQVSGWNVTHIPSGAICGHALNVKNARRVAEIMAPFCNAVANPEMTASDEMLAMPNFRDEFAKAKELFYA